MGPKEFFWLQSLSQPCLLSCCGQVAFPEQSSTKFLLGEVPEDPYCWFLTSGFAKVLLLASIAYLNRSPYRCYVFLFISAWHFHMSGLPLLLAGGLSGYLPSLSLVKLQLAATGGNSFSLVLLWLPLFSSSWWVWQGGLDTLGWTVGSHHFLVLWPQESSWTSVPCSHSTMWNTEM